MPAEPVCEFPRDNASDDEMRGVLENARSIAVVGLSPNPDRPSHRVASYMKAAGYRIIPVNPTAVEILGEKSYASVDEIPGPIDIVDIFRKPEAVPEIVDGAIRRGARAVWMQQGVVHNAAAEKARSSGLSVTMNRCIKIAHARLLPYSRSG